MGKYKQYLSKLVELNKSDNHDGMADLTLHYINDLVVDGYLTEDIHPTEKGLKEVRQVVEIVLDIRRDFQEDHEKLTDFSNYYVAFDVLGANGVKVNGLK